MIIYYEEKADFGESEFIKHISSAHYVLGAVEGNYRVSKTDRILPVKNLTFYWGMESRK